MLLLLYGFVADSFMWGTRLQLLSANLYFEVYDRTGVPSLECDNCQYLHGSVIDVVGHEKHIQYRVLTVMMSFSNGSTRVLAVDVAGAFDKVSHPGLLHKASRYGLSGALLAWLQDYLCDRRLQTTINGFTSSFYPISAGVPQGSILGPTLYLLYTNDAEDHLPAGVELAAYADDTTLYQSVHTIGDVPESARILQSAVDALAAWGEG